jgi:hypothetical protein
MGEIVPPQVRRADLLARSPQTEHEQWRHTAVVLSGSGAKRDENSQSSFNEEQALANAAFHRIGKLGTPTLRAHPRRQ